VPFGACFSLLLFDLLDAVMADDEWMMDYSG
jgi:hypothetical protein